MRPPFPLITPRQSFGFGAVVLCAGFAAQVQASGFLEDTTAKIESRTVYFNRDFRDGHTSSDQGASKREESAQGFILNLQSGYTEGTVGFGIDALGMAGFQLDSSPDRSNSGLLPSSGDNPRGSKGQYAGLVQQLFEFEVGAGADQFEVETERLVEGFATGEAQHLQVGGGAFEGKGNVGSVGVQHALNSVH